MTESIKRLNRMDKIQAFESRVDPSFQYAESLDVLQVNVGRLCNLSCRHCHVEAGPDRREIMGREVMKACMEVCREQKVRTVDITGGAPEMNPGFQWFAEEMCKRSRQVMVRSNLVILTEMEYRHLPRFYADHKIEVVCSLPYYRAREMDRVRGEGSFGAAIKVIRELNELGYGREEGLVLNMVYNPAGAYFPPSQAAMEKEYKARLWNDYGIVFDHLFTITNNPTGRFFQFLEKSGNLEDYMMKLCGSFNKAALKGLMCRNQISVGYDGRIYDCDFNQAAGLPVLTGENIAGLVGKPFAPRKICFGNHCYGCTAGQGSSCGGATES